VTLLHGHGLHEQQTLPMYIMLYTSFEGKVEVGCTSQHGRHLSNHSPQMPSKSYTCQFVAHPACILFCWQCMWSQYELQQLSYCPD
jgi:hypothetical protein